MPMRVIAKKRCRALFEPPEKGERATLNPNLSTRLKPTFFSDHPLGSGLAIAGRGGRAALSRRSSSLGLTTRSEAAPKAASFHLSYAHWQAYICPSSSLVMVR